MFLLSDDKFLIYNADKVIIILDNNPDLDHYGYYGFNYNLRFFKNPKNFSTEYIKNNLNKRIQSETGTWGDDMEFAGEVWKCKPFLHPKTLDYDVQFLKAIENGFTQKGQISFNYGCRLSIRCYPSEMENIISNLELLEEKNKKNSSKTMDATLDK